MKIAVFGGSFNPVHNGHCEMVRQLQKQLSLDKVLVVPAKIPPHKSAFEYAPDYHRMKMCELGFEGEKGVEISDIELKSDSVSYTYLTLLSLAKEYKNAELYLVCGSDMFLTLQNWKNPQIIFENATICAFSRDNEEDKIMEKQKSALEEMGAKVILCKGEIPSVSSTQIRKKVKCGESIDSLTPKSVCDYIYNNEIYR